MTFVKTRLLIERMSSGDTAEILLKGEEPIENVPASVIELGHTILSMAPAAADARAEPAGAPAEEVMRLKIRRA